jgi:hypothetical protein
MRVLLGALLVLGLPALTREACADCPPIACLPSDPQVTCPGKCTCIGHGDLGFCGTPSSEWLPLTPITSGVTL